MKKILVLLFVVLSFTVNAQDLKLVRETIQDDVRGKVPQQFREFQLDNLKGLFLLSSTDELVITDNLEGWDGVIPMCDCGVLKVTNTYTNRTYLVWFEELNGVYTSVYSSNSTKW